METQPDVLVIEDLVKEFVLTGLGGKIITGCEGISLRMKQGEFLGISGPSGSGKSTIIKCIYRTYLPTSGSIIYRTADDTIIDLATADDRSVLAVRKREIAYVSQFLRVIPRVPAIDLLAEGLLKKGWTTSTARYEAKEYLKMMNIDRSHWDAFPAFFSGGEQQRINLVRALITRPRLLLLDEPTASLDHDTKQLVIKALKEIKNSGTTVLAIFHDLESMNKLADRVFVMKTGQGNPMKAAEVI